MSLRAEIAVLALSINKRKTLETAQKYVQKGALDKALKEYLKLQKAEPKDTKIRLKIGDLHLKKGDRDAAIATYSEVADIFANEGFDARAVAIHKQILRIDGAPLHCRTRLAELYQRLGLASDALREYQDAVKECQERGLKAEAFELLKRVAQLDPTNVTSRLSLADLLLREEMLDQAQEEYESLLEALGPGVEPEIAERVATQLLEAFPENTRGLTTLAKAKLDLGNAQEAIDFLRKVLPRLPDDIALRQALVRAYESTGDSAGAQTVYREIAELYKRRGDDDKARDILQRYVPVQPFSDPNTSPSMGMDEGSPLELAATEVSTPIPMGLPDDEVLTPPPNASVEDLLAEAQVALEFDGLDDAERCARQVLSLEAHSDRARGILAEVFAKRGNKDQALRLHGERRDMANAIGDAELLAEIEARILELRGRSTSGAPVPEDDALEIELEDEANTEVPGVTGPSVSETPVLGDIELVEPAPANRGGPARAPAPLRVTEFDDDPDDIATLPDIELVLDDEEDHNDRFASVDPPEGVEAFGSEEIEIEFEEPVEAKAEPEVGVREPELEESVEFEESIEFEEPVAVPEPEPVFEESIEFEEPVEVEQPLAAPEPEAEFEESIEFEESVEVDEPVAQAEPPAAAAAPRAARRAARAEADTAPEVPPEAGSASKSWADDSRFVEETLEEAEFYHEQGMREEAERLYRAILERVPAHPKVLLRLGELTGEGTEQEEEPPEAEAELEDTPVEDLEEDADEIPSMPELSLDGDAPVEVVSEEAEVEAEAEDESELEVEVEVAAESAAAEVTEPLESEAEAEPEPNGDPSQSDSKAIDSKEIETKPEPAPAIEELEDEGDFDLAAALAGDLEEEAGGASGSDEIGFEGVFSAFKKGIQEQIGDGEPDAHFDLAIAYREMGLLDDALGELEIVQRSGVRELEVLTLMAGCKIELDRAEESISHLQEALKLPEASGQVNVSLQYDLGAAWLACGDSARALEAFRAAADGDPDFRDVADRIAELEKARS